MLEVKRPGKLFIAGEYSVVESGHYAIVAAIDRFIKARIYKSDHFAIKSFEDELLNFELDCKTIKYSSEDDKWSYIKSAIKNSFEYLDVSSGDYEHFNIEIVSQMEDSQGNKFGIGSSAAVTVAVIDAIMKFYKQNIDNLQLFKLAVLSTLENSTNNSCADLAAVCFASLVFYRKFDRELLIKDMIESSVRDLVNKEWELLEIKQLDFPNSWDFLVGWTGKPASSKNLVEKLKKNGTCDMFYRVFQNNSDRYVKAIYEALLQNDFKKFKHNIDMAEANLFALDHEFNIGIVTEKLKKLSQIAKVYGLTSKLSGAGGGDCGIAFYESSQYAKVDLEESWAENGIKALDFKIYRGEMHV